MTEIGLKEMVEALGAFLDFSKVQGGKYEEEFRHRLAQGEDPIDLLEEKLGEQDPHQLAEAVRRLRESVGVSDQAMRAFWIATPAFGIDPDDPEQSKALFIGLFVGLRARQFADEWQ